MANLIAGAILTFSFAMLEVSDSLILARSSERGRSRSRRRYSSCTTDWAMGRILQTPRWGFGDEVLLTVTLVGAAVLMGKRLGAMFKI